MIKLNRTTEYGLLALSYIREKNHGADKTLTASAREIAEHFHLPFEILAKTLQRLKDHGIIGSSFGTRGGYALTTDLKKLSLAEFLKMMEGPVSVVSCCAEETTSCEFSSGCSIQSPMQALNTRITDFLSRISLDELTQKQTVALMSASTAGIRTTSHGQTIAPLGNPAYGEEP